MPRSDYTWITPRAGLGDLILQEHQNLFADDLGGPSTVAELLALCLLGFSNRPTDLPLSTYPRLLVLHQWDNNEVWGEDIATRNFLRILARKAEKKHGILTGTNRKLKQSEVESILTAQFGGLRVVAYPHIQSPYRSWKHIRTRILKDSDELQARIRQEYIAFNTHHFKDFFSLAYQYFCVDIVTPFCFVRASRIQNALPPGFVTHLRSFLKLVSPVQLLNFAAPVIASAFMFDS
ncbi:hypothetical protein BJ878DRAFT_560145 [Calycina marina]|uniref:Uncharacterized protein n=1 Tax=Calycina marina TaxID=1763456 RepID=A0A9P8CB77_9HELO|nr:hypothetical protein BJ878DRAFT_560145 [Calycina marina]